MRIFFSFLIALSFIILEYFAYAQTQRRLRLAMPLYAEDAAFEPVFVSELNQYLLDDDIVVVSGRPIAVRLIKEIKKGKNYAYAAVEALLAKTRVMEDLAEGFWFPLLRGARA